MDNETSVNIEMQSISKKNFKERVLFYLAKLYTWNLKSGEDYKKIHPAYSLIFTDFTVFKEIKEYCSIFHLRSEKDPWVVFSRHLGIVLVELEKFKKERLKDFEKKDLWCYLIKNAKRITEEELKCISERGYEMKEAVVRIRKLSKEESELMIEEAIEKNRRDKVAEIEYARDEGLEQGMREGIEKGMERGIEQGMEKGMEKGKREGIEQGMERGIEKGKKEGIEQGMERGIEKGKKKGIEQGMEKGMELVAVNMLKSQMDMDVITRMTGLSTSEILKLKKNLN